MFYLFKERFHTKLRLRVLVHEIVFAQSLHIQVEIRKLETVPQIYK